MAIDINFLALLAAVAINMAVGYIWYGPNLFGKTWQKLVGLSDKDIKQSDTVTPMVAMLLLAIVEVFVLLHFIKYTQFFYPEYGDLSIGILTGLWAWAGFVAPAMVGSYMFARRRKKLLAIDAGYQLVVIVLAAIVLSVWK